MFEEKYQQAVSILLRKSPKIFKLIFPHRKIMKYITSGGLAALSAFLSLYFLTEIIGFWYVLSSAIASIVGTIVSFCFQKFWTFRDKSTDKIKSQALFYVGVLLINMAFNALGIFALVDFLSINYLIAQMILFITIAFANFFVFGKFIFKV